jgi:heme/copper-type cytochrome/quinol oxidase subunit 4
MGGGMGFGGGGLIGFLLIAVLVVVPFWRLLPQYRIPNWVALVAIIPLGAVILLWVMAFRDKLDGGTS